MNSAKQSGAVLAFSLVLFFCFGADGFFRVDLFAAPLVSMLYVFSLTLSLWVAVMCGLIKDALMGSSRFGIIALSYVIALMILHKGRYLFKDWLGTLPLMTALFSAIATLAQFFTLFFFNSEQCNYSFGWFLTDCIAMPFFDGMYGFFLFILLPLLLRRRVVT